MSDVADDGADDGADDVADVRVRIEVHLDGDGLRDALRHDVEVGLTASFKDIPPKWFYDERGSALFEAITELPEYYPTRTERSILIEHAAVIAATAQADTLVELGAGTSEKTRLLLDALGRQGTLRRFVPFDVAESVLRDAAAAIVDEYPGITVHAVVGDFERHIDALPRDGRRLVAFLGGTIGNLDRPRRRVLLRELAATMNDGDTVLIGTDLVKGLDRLLPAYEDAAGVTAAFNKNVLAVINRELKADFDLDDFDHVACYDGPNDHIEMRLRSRRAHTVRVELLDLDVTFAAGEEMRTELSAKFQLDGFREELEASGFTRVTAFTDPAGDFALWLARR